MAKSRSQTWGGNSNRRRPAKKRHDDQDRLAEDVLSSLAKRAAVHNSTALVERPRTDVVPRRREPSAFEKAEDDRRRRVIAGQRARRMPYLATATTAAVGYVGWGVTSVTGAYGGSQVVAATTMGLVSAAAVMVLRWARKTKRVDRWGRRFWWAGLSAAGWVSVASMAGVGWPVLAALVGGAAMFSARWLRAHEVPIPPPPRARRRVDTELNQLERIAAVWHDEVAVKGSQVPRSYLTSGDYYSHGMVWSLRLRGGVTLGEVQSRAAKIASLMDMDPIQLVFDYPPAEEGQKFRSASRLRFQVVTDSPVVDEVDFTRPQFTNGKIALGPHADGRGAAELSMFTKNSMWSTIVIGSTGSGKTSLIDEIVVSARSSGHLATWYIDPKGNSSSDLAGAASVAERGLDRAEEFTAAVEGLLRRRQLEAGINGWNGFTAGPQRRAYLIVVDECDLLFEVPGMAVRWARIAKTGRALGIGILAATQYAGLAAVGNSELLRSSLAAGSVILMRTESNTSDKLIAPKLPNSRDLPQEPGYGYLQSRDSRAAPFRAAYLPSSDDNPDGWNAAKAFAEYPDAAMDEIGLRSSEHLAVGSAEERHQESIARMQTIFDELMGRAGRGREVRKQDPKITAVPESSGGPSDLFRMIPQGGRVREAVGEGAEVVPLRPPSEAPPVRLADMSGTQRQVWEALLAGRTRTGEIAEHAGLKAPTVSRTLAILADLGVAVRVEHGVWRIDRRPA